MPQWRSPENPGDERTINCTKLLDVRVLVSPDEAVCPGWGGVAPAAGKHVVTGWKPLPTGWVGEPKLDMRVLGSSHAPAGGADEGGPSYGVPHLHH